MKTLTEDDYLFDGFAHRKYDPGIDGWRNVMPDPMHFQSVQMAHETLDMFHALCEAKKRVWELEKEVEELRAALMGGYAK